MNKQLETADLPPKGQGWPWRHYQALEIEQISLLWADTYKRRKAARYMTTGEQ